MTGLRALLVHGVGIGSWSYRALAADLAADHEVVVASRWGYGVAAAPAASFEELVEDIARLAGGPAAFVGVSGGATLVLALAVAHPELVAAAVVHEPLVGPVAHELHVQVSAAAGQLAATPGEAGVVDFLRTLVGPSAWDRLSPGQRAGAMRNQAVVRAEVPLFLAFAPTPAQLAGLAGAPVLSSVGEESPRIRKAAAAVVAGYTARSPAVLPGVGHLAQLEGPAALAGLLRSIEGGALGALQGGAGGDEEVLATRPGDELHADR